MDLLANAANAANAAGNIPPLPRPALHNVLEPRDRYDAREFKNLKVLSSTKDWKNFKLHADNFFQTFGYMDIIDEPTPIGNPTRKQVELPNYAATLDAQHAALRLAIPNPTQDQIDNLPAIERYEVERESSYQRRCENWTVRNGRLYQAFTKVCKGEAKDVLGTCERFNGKEAWKLLTERFDKHTVVDNMAKFMELFKMKQGTTKIETHVAEWQEVLRDLGAELRPNNHMTISMFFSSLNTKFDHWIDNMNEEIAKLTEANQALPESSTYYTKAVLYGQTSKIAMKGEANNSNALVAKEVKRLLEDKTGDLFALYSNNEDKPRGTGRPRPRGRNTKEENASNKDFFKMNKRDESNWKRKEPCRFGTKCRDLQAGRACEGKHTRAERTGKPCNNYKFITEGECSFEKREPGSCVMTHSKGNNESNKDRNRSKKQNQFRGKTGTALMAQLQSTAQQMKAHAEREGIDASDYGFPCIEMTDEAYAEYKRTEKSSTSKAFTAQETIRMTFDTGATAHMGKDSLPTVNNKDYHGGVTIANGDTIDLSTIGEIKSTTGMNFHVKTGKDMAFNLFSGHQCVQKGCTVQLSEKDSYIELKTGKKVPLERTAHGWDLVLNARGTETAAFAAATEKDKSQGEPEEKGTQNTDEKDKSRSSTETSTDVEEELDISSNHTDLQNMIDDSDDDLEEIKTKDDTTAENQQVASKSTKALARINQRTKKRRANDSQKSKKRRVKRNRVKFEIQGRDRLPNNMSRYHR